VRQGRRSPSDVNSDQQILDAALRCFADKGYHGSTIREIAERAGVSVAGLYHHFPSKRHLLERLMDDTMDALIAATERAVDEIEDPVALLRATVAAHVRFHIEFQQQSFVGNTELRSLVSPARERIVRKRDRQRALFDKAVARGLASGAFRTEYPAEATRAVVTMCTAVATWYRPDRPLSPDQLVDRYCELALRMVSDPTTPRRIDD
jgi:AcrR family transcriptional regulator